MSDDDDLIETARGMAAAMVQTAKAYPCGKHPSPLVMLTACIMLTETVATSIPGEADATGKAVLLLATQLLTGKLP